MLETCGNSSTANGLFMPNDLKITSPLSGISLIPVSFESKTFLLQKSLKQNMHC